MISDVYLVDGKYPDPYEVRAELERLRSDSDNPEKYHQALSELSDSGLSRHPLLSSHRVES